MFFGVISVTFDTSQHIDASISMLYFSYRFLFVAIAELKLTRSHLKCSIPEAENFLFHFQEKFFHWVFFDFNLVKFIYCFLLK